MLLRLVGITRSSAASTKDRPRRPPGWRLPGPRNPGPRDPSAQSRHTSPVSRSRNGPTGPSAGPRVPRRKQFPLGMYAACSFTVGQVTRITGIAGFGHVWTWVAFTVSLLVLAGLFRRGWPVLRGQHRPAAGSGELQGHAGQRGAISEQPVLDLDIVGRRVCRARLLVIEIAARHPCVRIRADGQPCLGHRGE